MRPGGAGHLDCTKRRAARKNLASLINAIVESQAEGKRAAAQG
jgi:hypothetical protein